MQELTLFVRLLQKEAAYKGVEGTTIRGMNFC